MYTALIVDDEPLICDCIAQAAQCFPEIHSVHKFYDGQDAYDFLEENKVDICLLDVTMPGKTGLEIAQLLNLRSKNTSIIIISAHRDFAYAQSAMQFGVNDYLTKPFSSDALMALIRKSIAVQEEHSASKQRRWKITKDFIMLLTQSSSTDMDIPNVMLCAESTPLTELACTEVCISIPALPTLPYTSQEALFSCLQNRIERDSPQQSSFCYKSSDDTVIALVFARQFAELSFIHDAVSLLGEYGCDTYNITSNTYSSFREYLNQPIFKDTMDTYSTLLSASGPVPAKASVDAFLQNADPSLIEEFSRFLNKHYDLSIEAVDLTHITEALDILQKRFYSRGSNVRLITASKAYIAENFSSNDLSLDVLATRLCVSTEHLSRSFKKVTGQGFSDYLMDYRIKKAKELLEKTNMSISQISNAVGFSSAAYFRRCFKICCGIVPTQYRKIHPGNKEDIL